MEIRFNVNRPKSFEAGYDVTSSPVVLEVNPDQLSIEERQLIASRMNQSGDICRRDRDGRFYDGTYHLPRIPSKTQDGKPLESVSLVTADFPTVESLLAAIRAEEAEIIAHHENQERQKAERERQVRDRTLEALHQRRTIPSSRSISARRGEDGSIIIEDTHLGTATYSWMALVPDWPYKPDETVVNSPEALAWKAELEPENHRRKEQAKLEVIKLLLEREEQEAKDLAVRERRKAEKQAWIAQHGSDRLRKAVELGYDCQRLYVTERVQSELPEFEIDFKDTADWCTRSCPSEEALNIVLECRNQGFDAKVVWLTDPPSSGHNDDGDDYFEPCEAVVVEGYLDKYTLVRII